MALPCCPDCGRPDLAVVDAACEIRQADDDRLCDPRRHRSYLCRCGWSGVSEERIVRHRPRSLRLRRKFGQPVVRIFARIVEK